MKKSHLTAAALTLLALTACGSKTKAPAETNPAPTTAVVKEETTTVETEAVKEDSVDAASEFAGVWRYGDSPYFLELNDDSSFVMHHFGGQVEYEGNWALEGDCVSLTTADGEHWTDISFTADETLLDSENNAELYSWEIPEFSKGTIENFTGVWQYDRFPLFVVINEDSAEIINSSGESTGEISISLEDGVLNFLTSEGIVNDSFYYDSYLDSIMDSGMNGLMRSELPTDWEKFSKEWENDGNGGEYNNYFACVDYLGSWKYNGFNMWLYIYEDGTYETIYEDGNSASGYWEINDDSMSLYSSYGGYNTDLYFGGDGTLFDTDGDELYPEIPPFNRYWY